MSVLPGGGYEVDVEITQEMARKVLEESEESEEIKVGEKFIFTTETGRVLESTYLGEGGSNEYKKEQDNFLHSKLYSEQQAKDYFNKRDARRAAEYRIKKAIEKMNGDKGRNSEMYYFRHITDFVLRADLMLNVCYSAKELTFHHSIGDYMLEHHTEDYKIYLGIE
jgi:hypothetical protein